MTLSHHRDASRQPLDNASAPPAGLHRGRPGTNPPGWAWPAHDASRSHMTPARQPGSSRPTRLAFPAI